MPLPPTLRITGVTGHSINLVDYVELEVSVLNKTVKRPFLVVSGLSQTSAILGYDFIKEEGLMIDGAADSVYFKTIDPEATLTTWTDLPLTAIRRTTVLPRTAQILEVTAIHHKRHLEPGTTGIVSADPRQCLGTWDALVQFQESGNTYITVTNLSEESISVKAGDTVAQVRNPAAHQDDLQPLDDQAIATIFGDIGKDPKDPRRGLVESLTETEKKTLRERLQVKATGQWKKDYEDLLLLYHDVCSKDKYDLGWADVITHKIVMPDDLPVHKRQFRVPFNYEQVLFKYVDELLKQGAIEVSRSPYNSPIFCVRKKLPPNFKQGDPIPLRIVLDYRAINLKSVPDRYCIKEVRECVDEVGRNASNIFTTVDLTAGFWQQALEESSRQYTAFTIPGKGARYQWRVTPMGLQGSPASFSRLMDYVMREIEGCLTYVDDVLVHSNSHGKHLVQLEEVLWRLRKYGLKLNVDKTIIGASEVQYLGYTLTKEGVSPSVDKMKAVKDFTTPRDTKSIREFVGLANYFRFLIPQFALLAGPLTALTKTSSTWKGGELPPAAKECFEKLKSYLCSAPLVAYPDRERKFVLHTDAATGDAERPGGLGAVLLQEQKDGTERVVAYASRALKDHERNYSAFLLEMAAACFGIDHFDTYLKGKHFKLCTDHRPLEKLNTQHTKTLNRLQQLMLEYDFELQYKEGTANQVADFLSRNVVAAVADTDEEVQRLQREDQHIGRIIRFLDTGELPADKRDAMWVKRMADSCFLENNVLWYRIEGKTRQRFALYAPPQIRDKLVEAAHVGPDAGHGGVDRTVERIKQAYYWQGMTGQVQKFLDQCLVCQKSKARLPKQAPLQSMPIAIRPNERVHIDLFGAMRTSNAGNKFVMVMTDAFTKAVELVAIETKHAEVVARAFFERWICRYSAPEMILTDQGKEFCNKMLEELCRLWKIDKKRTSPFHPETNASAERFNRTMIGYLRATLDNTATLDWEELLPPMMLSYNTHVHKSTGDTPFFLTYLHDPRLPYFDLEKPRRFYDDSYVHEAFKLMQVAYHHAKANLEQASQVQKEYFDKKTEERSFDQGDRVLVYFPNPPPGVNQKFYDRWEEFEVIKMVGRVNVQVRRLSKGKPMIVHINRVVKARTSMTVQEQEEVEVAYLAFFDGPIVDERELDKVRQEDEEWQEEGLKVTGRRTGAELTEEQSVSQSTSSSEEEEVLFHPLFRIAARVFPATADRRLRSQGQVEDVPLPERCPAWRPRRQL